MKTNKVSEKKIVKEVRKGFKENIVPKNKKKDKKDKPLSADLLRKINAYWRAANYLSVGQISSFLSITGTEALQMGMSANPRGILRTRTTRFVSDFGNISPAPKRGDQLE
jgi:hypothetical protein